MCVFQITVEEHSEEHSSSKEYEHLRGSVGVTYGFINVRAKADEIQSKEVVGSGSKDAKLSFKVRSVQINRPWLNLSALQVDSYKIPGVKAGSWSTGELNSKNNGSLPLISNQMIVAKDITVTASKFDSEITETMMHFDASAQAGLLVSICITII